MPGRPLLDYPAAAAYLGITEWKLRNLTHRQLIDFVKMPPGGRTAPVRFDPDELDRFIRQHTVPARSAS